MSAPNRINKEYKWYWYTIVAIIVGWSIGSILVRMEEIKCGSNSLSTLDYSDRDENLRNIEETGELDGN